MKIGDKVRVKESLVVGGNYKADFIPEMIDFLGKEAKIVEIIYQGSYGLNIDIEQEYEFTEDMLELI
jgi:hypothetical protein